MYLFVSAQVVLPALTPWDATEVLVAAVTAVSPVVTHQRVRHALHLVSAREVRASTGHKVGTLSARGLVGSEAVALGVTGQEVVGGVVEGTGRHRLPGPVGRRREEDACGVGSFSRGLEVERAEVGCLPFLVTRHDRQCCRPASEGRAVRGPGTSEGHVQIDGKRFVRPQPRQLIPAMNRKHTHTHTHTHTQLTCLHFTP